MNTGLLRLNSLRGKLIIPYVLLTLLLASVGIFIVTRLVTSSIRERFINQIYEASRVAADGVVRQERKHLENLRLMAFTVGLPEAIAARDLGGIQDLLLPVALNNQVDAVTAIDRGGKELLTLGRDPLTNEYLASQDQDFSSIELVKSALLEKVDRRGDKYIQLLDTRFGKALFTSAPVRDSSGELVGVLLVGTQLQSLLEEIKSQALADLIILDQNSQLASTTLPRPENGYGILVDAVLAFQQPEPAVVQNLKLYGRQYEILYSPLVARNQRLGWMGVILPGNFVVSLEATSRNLFTLIFGIGTILVILIGYVLSQSIARPILRLREMSQSVAAGDLEQQSGLKRSDEIGELAEAFDAMTERLSERTEEAERLYQESVQRNKELAESNQRLQNTQQQLIQSEKLASVGQLTAGIVHDIKNPIAVVMGVSDLLMQEDELVNRQEIRMIQDSAAKANQIVTDLLKFARQTSPEMKRQDLRETVEAALRLEDYVIRKAVIQVSKEFPDEPVLVTYDAQLLEQVFVNLIHNAVQAMSKNGLLRLCIQPAGENVATFIQDSGVGIPPENLSRIFDPFFTTKPEGQGTGLGLSVSYGIIASHGGKIDVESKVGQGTTFTIWLPYEQPVPLLLERPA